MSEDRDIFHEAIDVAISITEGVLKPPASLFWLLFATSTISYIVSLLFNLSLFKVKVPTLSDLLDVRHREFIWICHVVSMVCLVKILFLIEDFYKKAQSSAAPMAKVLINRYTLFMNILVYSNVISHVIVLIIRQSSSFVIHHISLVVYYVTFALFYVYSEKLHIVKRASLYPPGYSLTYALYVLLCLIPCYYFLQYRDGDGYIYYFSGIICITIETLLYVRIIPLGYDILRSKFTGYFYLTYQ